MQERQRDDGFEATFVVSTPRTEAWKLLTEARPASDALPTPGPGQWWIPGVEGAADELEVVPERLLRTRKATFPCDGTEIVIAMEDAETGTRITFSQFGFGPDFDERRPWLEAGWWAIRADLFLYFEHGATGGRHLRPWTGIGCGVDETPGGLTVTDVQSGSCAAQAGLEVGDLILTIAGSPVLTVRDLSVLMRGPLRPGSDVKVRYARGGELLSGRGLV
jgi:membrane-associated protease RseP (regulator of RpoE activity)